MSEWIGDLMAMADESYGHSGGRAKRERVAKTAPEARTSAKDERSSRRRETGSTHIQAGAKGARCEKCGMSSGWAQSLAPVSLRVEKNLPPKRMGELSELDFLRKAMGMGMIVSKPWGDSYRYDFVVDWEGRLTRAQVRSTEERFGARGYAVHASVYVGKEIVGLTKRDIDVIVGYIVSRDIWYVVPVEAFEPRKNLWFYPDGSKKGAMFEKFREAWWVITGKKSR